MQAESNEENYSLPIGMRYNLGIADSVPAERNITQFVSSNATSFSGEGTNVCRIPVSSGNFLDLNNAVLQFDFKNTTDTHDVQFDGSVACVIEQIDIIAGGQTIETVRHYNQLDAILDQYASSQGTLRQNSILKGGVARIDDTAEFKSVAPASVSSGDVATITQPESGLVFTAKQTIAGIASEYTLTGKGGIGYDQSQSTVLATNKNRRFTFPLRGCGFLNPATSKLLPPNTPFQLSITFARSANCLVNLGANTAMTYAVSECELHVPEVRILDPTFMARMNSRMAQGLAWKTTGYDHFVNTIASSTGSTTVQISARARSLKGLMTIMRDQDNVSALQKFKLSKRSIIYTSEYSYRVGSSQFPAQPIAITGVGGTTGGSLDLSAGVRINKDVAGVNVGECYSHAMRLFGNLNKSGSDCLIAQEAFAQSELNNGCGILAMDLSAFSDGSVNSGMNTLNNLPVSLELNRTDACALATNNIQIDTYSVHELVIIRDPSGQLSSLY
jgi:hypothetical protein